MGAGDGSAALVVGLDDGAALGARLEAIGEELHRTEEM
jgi:hypothetical protein